MEYKQKTSKQKPVWSALDVFPRLVVGKKLPTLNFPMRVSSQMFLFAQ